MCIRFMIHESYKVRQAILIATCIIGCGCEKEHYAKLSKGLYLVTATGETTKILVDRFADSQKTDDPPASAGGALLVDNVQKLLFR